ncbi:helix-turn-helix transcriptional regulator [Saccharopolyspora taberi]|uniref:helix-turn-helix transcriptional regulator n=1 Tax=Saccharopolyspora taberi TaxID=60895 RepID=UPI0031D95472
MSLAELTQPDLLPMTAMAALTAESRAGAGVAELSEYIGDQRMLLLLDNCEHMTEACAKLVADLLRNCPELRVLATSREALRVEGEAPYTVPPLAVPEMGQLRTGDSHNSESVMLFLERASILRPGLTLTSDDEQAVVALCRRLDGLPLAIELAAARIRALSIGELVNRYNDVRVLTSGSRNAPSRQQTLRATMDYSYRLCSPEARALWARMSVFSGGADLTAVEAVCAGGMPSRDLAEETLSELVDKSIVTFDGVRYRMLDTLREYGRERLRTLSEEQPTRTAHRDHFAALADEAATSWFSPDQPALLGRIQAELANIRAALEFCLTEPGEVDTGLRMASDLWYYWLGCGRQREGRLWLDRLLAVDSGLSPERVAALWVNSYLAVYDGDIPAGLRLLDQYRELATPLNDPAVVAHATYIRGLAELFQGGIEDAISLLDEGVRLERGLPELSPLYPPALIDFGSALCYRKQPNRAVAVLQEARNLSTAHGDQWLLAWSLVFLGLAELIEQRVPEAVALLNDGLARQRALDDILGLNIAVEFLAWAALTASAPDAERAARLMGASQALRESLGAHLAGIQRLLEWHEQYARRAQEILGQRAFNAALENGRELGKDDAIAYALDEKATRHRTADSDLPLTPREREIAKLVASGKTNKKIAAELVIATRTVDSHVEHILTKLGFNSRTQIAALFAKQVPDS